MTTYSDTSLSSSNSSDKSIAFNFTSFDNSNSRDQLVENPQLFMTENERDITDLLLVCSAGMSCAIQPKKRIVRCGISEAMVGWRDIVSHAKYDTREGSAKKRKSTDKHLDVEDFPQVDSEQKIGGVRCIGDDFSVNNTPSSWKACVEMGSYRYIVNNGFYRAIKFLDSPEDWYTITKQKPEKVSQSLRKKQLQRELKRDLKRELANNAQSSKESRLLSAQSDGVCSKCHHEQKSPMTSARFPTVSKSTGHLNTSPQTEITNLEADEKVNQISAVENPSKTERSLLRPDPEKNRLKYTHRPAKEIACPVVYSLSSKLSDVLTEQTFSIRAISKENLKPLEKVTPRQRFVEDTHKLSVSQSKYTDDNDQKNNHKYRDLIIIATPPSHSTSSEPDMHKSAVNKKRSITTTPAKDNKVTSSSSFFVTTKIQPLVKVSKSAKASADRLSSPTLFDGFHSAPIGKKNEREKKDSTKQTVLPNQNVTGVSGKRVDVAETNHRWL